MAAEDSETATAPSEFERSFGRRARRVRGLLALRTLLGGIAGGAAAGALLTGVAWWLRLGTVRPLALAAGVGVGLVAGAVLAFRRRWSDADVALYLDAKLGSSEAIVTAVEPRDSEAHATARDRATKLLGSREAARTAPRVLTRLHALFPVASATAVWLSVIPLPPRPLLPPPPPGAERVKLTELAGLERIEALAKLGGANPAQDERLKRLAAEAKKLREDLAKGLEKREALARIARLRDEVAAERLRFGDRENRAGLDAAVAELERQKLTGKAGRALSEGDITAFDAEMQRLAALAEKEDRDTAKRALDEAQKAAKEKGAHALSETLEREKKKLEQAEAKMEALRELARELGNGLDEDGRRALGEANESGNPDAQRRLAEALDRALAGMTEEERKRLAERLRQALGSGGEGQQSPMTAEELEDLAKRLEQKGAEDRLREELRELARREPSEDAQRERGLGDAERGGSDAERSLGAMPMPLGNGQGAGSGPKQETPQTGGDGKGQGTGKDQGTGKHDGKTAPLDVKELRSKAGGKLLPGAPMHAGTLGRAPARPGETANQLGTGALGKVGPTEVGAVEGSEIPEEYREQVGRYFEP
jgi:hypothetical protein